MWTFTLLGRRLKARLKSKHGRKKSYSKRFCFILNLSGDLCLYQKQYIIWGGIFTVHIPGYPQVIPPLCESGLKSIKYHHHHHPLYHPPPPRLGVLQSYVFIRHAASCAILISHQPVGEVDSGQTASIPQSEQNEPYCQGCQHHRLSIRKQACHGRWISVSPSGVCVSPMSDKLHRLSACWDIAAHIKPGVLFVWSSFQWTICKPRGGGGAEASGGYCSCPVACTKWESRGPPCVGGVMDSTGAPELKGPICNSFSPYTFCAVRMHIGYWRVGGWRWKVNLF